MKKKLPNKLPDDLILIITSDLNELHKVEDFAQIVSKKASLSEEQSDNMAIVLTELANNAIVHGNKRIPSKKVYLKAVFQADKVEVSVKDEGNGFDPAGLSDPTDPENIWKENGRGVFLVKNLVDEVKFISSPGGMEVVIIQYKKK